MIELTQRPRFRFYENKLAQREQMTHFGVEPEIEAQPISQDFTVWIWLFSGAL
jgi:hypothetical protein